MSKNYEDTTKEEKMETLQGTRWFIIGRAGMLEQLSVMFVDRAGECFKRGNDSSAKELRELSIEMTELAIGERKSQADVDEKIEALEKQD